MQFATAFELVVLAWSAARRGLSDAVVAGVVGSFAYNVTMSFGAGALARPLHITHPGQLHGPWVAMIAVLVAALALAAPRRRLGTASGWTLLAAYPLVAIMVLPDDHGVFPLDGRQGSRGPVRGLVPDPDGAGYWLVAATGASSPSTPPSAARWAPRTSTARSSAWLRLATATSWSAPTAASSPSRAPPTASTAAG